MNSIVSGNQNRASYRSEREAHTRSIRSLEKIALQFPDPQYFSGNERNLSNSWTNVFKFKLNNHVVHNPKGKYHTIRFRLTIKKLSSIRSTADSDKLPRSMHSSHPRQHDKFITQVNEHSSKSRPNNRPPYTKTNSKL